jgi:hypothetical protein
MQTKIVAIFPLLVLTGACVTTPSASFSEAERASCQRMEEAMGLNAPHDHAAMKGAGMNPMNLSHERCLQILQKDGS